MDHQVIGTTMPVPEMQLEAGESIVAEGGELSSTTGPIELHTAAVAPRSTPARRPALRALPRGPGGSLPSVTERHL